MFKKFLVSFVVFAFVLAPFQATAQELEGQVTSLSLNEKAPYSGVLLDPIAASKMIINQKYPIIAEYHSNITASPSNI